MRNAVTLVWGSLRLAPITGIQQFWSTVDVEKCRRYIHYLKKVLPKVIMMQQAIELGQYIHMSVVERSSELNIHTFLFVTHQLYLMIQAATFSLVCNGASPHILSLFATII